MHTKELVCFVMLSHVTMTKTMSIRFHSKEKLYNKEEEEEQMGGGGGGGQKSLYCTKEWLTKYQRMCATSTTAPTHK